MGSLAQEMTRIREEIGSSHEARKAFIHEIKESVIKTRKHANKMVGRFRKNRAERGRVEKETLTSFVSGLKTNVGEIVRGFGNDRAGMAQETRAALLECVSGVKEFVSGLKPDVDEMLEAFEDDRMEKFAETKTKLSQLISGLRYDVDEMLGRFHSERSDMTRETKSELLECLSNTKQFVTDIKDYVFALQTGFSKTRMKKAKESRKERERFIADLVREVSRLREGVRSLRLKTAEDFRLAGQVWRGLVASPSHADGKTFAIRPKKAMGPRIETKGGAATESHKKPVSNIVKQTARQPYKTPKIDKFFPDDLTMIQGIGPGRETRLNEAGINTFAKLADTKPETLREAFEGMGGQVDVAKWITAARKFSRKPR